jgi:hypothetical protein
MKSRRLILTVFLSSIIALLSGCFGGSKAFTIESYKTDANADVSQLKTYHWNFDGLREAVPTGGHLPEFNRVLCEHVDQLMSEMGYERVAPEQAADFVLDYRIVIITDTAALADSNETPFPNVEEVNDYSLRWRFDERSAPQVEAPKDRMVPFQRGLLHLGASNDSGQTLWHYSVSKILNERANEAERRAAVRIAVDKLMKQFPKKQQP